MISPKVMKWSVGLKGNMFEVHERADVLLIIDTLKIKYYLK